MRREASDALRVDRESYGYQVGETVGRNSTPRRKLLGSPRAPAHHRVECSRCRDHRGLPRAFPPERISMVASADPMLVAMVCDGCLRPGEVVLERGGRLAHPSIYRLEEDES